VSVEKKQATEKKKVYGKQVKMVEINFLCVHQLYRDKRLAPALITGSKNILLAK
jgi:hypothetical protein